MRIIQNPSQVGSLAPKAPPPAKPGRKKRKAPAGPEIALIFGRGDQRLGHGGCVRALRLAPPAAPYVRVAEGAIELGRAA